MKLRRDRGTERESLDTFRESRSAAATAPLENGSGEREGGDLPFFTLLHLHGLKSYEQVYSLTGDF